MTSNVNNRPDTIERCFPNCCSTLTEDKNGLLYGQNGYQCSRGVRLAECQEWLGKMTRVIRASLSVGQKLRKAVRGQRADGGEAIQRKRGPGTEVGIWNSGRRTGGYIGIFPLFRRNVNKIQAGPIGGKRVCVVPHRGNFVNIFKHYFIMINGVF